MTDSISRRRFLGNTASLGAAVAASTLVGRAVTAEDKVEAVSQSMAQGYVFHDRYGDGVRRADCPGVAGVRVSNGQDIVLTDARGHYAISIQPGQILFVIKPEGWRVPVNENYLPQFYYIHKPEGSPQWQPSAPLSKDELAPEIYFAGSSPTGPLPSSIDFPLQPQTESSKFRCLVMADTQVGGMYQLHWMNRQSLREVAALDDIPFGFILGDVVNVGNLFMFDPLNESLRGCKIPCYMLVGNHDQNLMVPDNTLANETFQSKYGPDYYAFDYAQASFLVLNNVYRDPYDSKFRYEKGKFNFHRSRYHKSMMDSQWTFVENYLKTVPQNRLLVVMMHIPLELEPGSPVQAAFDRRLLQLLSGRPHTLSLSGHYHHNEHMFFGKSHGFNGPGEHHHLTCAAIRGNGYRGPYDDQRIPSNMCLDGCPCGYSFLNVDGTSYTIDYKAARRSEDLQMYLYLQDELTVKELASSLIVANVFSSSPRSMMKMRVDDGPWRAMNHGAPSDYDPMLLEILKLQGEDDPGVWGRRIPDKKPAKCANLWQGQLPDSLKLGMHQVTVQHTDMFGRTFEDFRYFYVKPEGA